MDDNLILPAQKRQINPMQLSEHDNLLYIWSPPLNLLGKVMVGGKSTASNQIKPAKQPRTGLPTHRRPAQAAAILCMSIYSSATHDAIANRAPGFEDRLQVT